MIFIYFLIIMTFFLIADQLITASNHNINKNIIEGLKNKSSDDSLSLAQTNAGNINVLRNQIKDCNCSSMNDKIKTLQEKVNQISESIQNNSGTTGDKPAEISGT